VNELSFGLIQTLSNPD